MKEKELFSDYAFNKLTDTITKNPRFMSWLNVNFHIKKLDGEWIIYDAKLTPLDIQKGNGFVDYEMTDDLLHWFYESYTTDQRIERESRDFISLDAYFESSNTIIAKIKKQRNTTIDPTIASIIAAHDWAAMKPRKTRYRTGSVEKDYQREVSRRYRNQRIESFPLDKYKDVLDLESLNRLVELCSNFPSLCTRECCPSPRPRWQP